MRSTPPSSVKPAMAHEPQAPSSVTSTTPVVGADETQVAAVHLHRGAHRGDQVLEGLSAQLELRVVDSRRGLWRRRRLLAHLDLLSHPDSPNKALTSSAQHCHPSCRASTYDSSMQLVSSPLATAAALEDSSSSHRSVRTAKPSWTIRSLPPVCGFDGAVVVVREEILKEVEAHLIDYVPVGFRIEFAIQGPRRGTAEAVACTAQLIDGPFAVPTPTTSTAPRPSRA